MFILFLIISIGSSGLPLGTQAPATVPGSTATTTIAPSPATHSSLPQQIAQPPPNYHVTQPLVNSLEPPNITPAVMPGSVMTPQPAKVCVGDHPCLVSNFDIYL